MSGLQRRGPWSQSEDSQLMHLVETQGALNWVKIAGMLHSRTPKQCRERYHQNLKPNLNHEPISAEEGQLIERLVSQVGKRWAEIARQLPNRSDNAVKNWWNGSMNRRKRLDRRRHSTENEHYTNRPTPLQMPSAPPYPQYHASAGWNYHQSGTPSPSTMSPGGESLYEGAPPSLVSDTASWYAPSPRQPESPIELPPLRMVEPHTPPNHLPAAYDARPTYQLAAPLPKSGVVLPPIRTTPGPPPYPPYPPYQPPSLARGDGRGGGEKDARMKLDNLVH